MKINEVAKVTGLSKKAIRLYESKGLLKIQRVSNGYRDYSESDVERLKQIKLLRLAGISISDVRLLFDRVVTIEEIIEKRKSDISKESGRHSAQYGFCEALTEQFRTGIFDCKYELEENEEITKEHYGALAVGIDIGTTTISATVVDLASRKQIECYNISNSFRVNGSAPFFALQDADGIVRKATELLAHIIGSYTTVTSIGITGQMHGIVYVDGNGAAVSSLVTWQDKRADCVLSDGETYCGRITRLTGERIATGFGLATHYYNVLEGLVPESAVTFCSIMDYFAMQLTGGVKPLIHSSVAASFGLFDIRQCRFMEDKIAQLPMGGINLPDVTDENACYGTYRDIPVSVAIGDNQASFLGSVKSLDNSVLINIGTGSQISMVSNYRSVDETVELRPLVKEKYLVCGSALCGGSAYALLERFFREYAVSIGAQDKPQYETMNQLAAEAYERNTRLHVDTTFCGTRNDPARRGGIYGVDEHNFSPANLTLGVIHGMCKELFDLFLAANGEGKTEVVASGGAVRRNRVLQWTISDMFGMPVSLSDNIEEASVGAALFSALAVGYLKSVEEFSDFIQYKSFAKEDA